MQQYPDPDRQQQAEDAQGDDDHLRVRGGARRGGLRRGSGGFRLRLLRRCFLLRLFRRQRRGIAEKLVERDAVEPAQVRKVIGRGNGEPRFP